MQGGVDFALPASLLNFLGQVLFAACADGHDGSVVEEDAKLFDVVYGLAAEQGMRAAGVVADHATDGAAIVGGGVGGEDELVGDEMFLQRVEDDAGLNTGELMFGIDLEDLVHVLGEIEDDGDVAALSGETGSSAAREDGSAVFSAQGDGGDDVCFVAGDDQADGDLAVVRRVGGVHGAASAVEADFAAHLLLEFALELRRLEEGVDGLGVGAERQRSERGRGFEAWSHDGSFYSLFCGGYRGMPSVSGMTRASLGFIQKAAIEPRKSSTMLPRKGSSQLLVLSMTKPKTKGERMAASAEPVFMRPLAEPE